MKHARLLISLLAATAVVFAAMVFHVAFSLRDVNVYYSVYTDGEVEKAEKLLKSFEGKNLLFLKEEEVESAIIGNTSLKVKKIEKNYPDALVVELVARQERFAVETADGEYFILDDEYSVTDKRADFANEGDGLANVLIEFELLTNPVLEVKGTLNVKNGALGAMAKTVAKFDSPRDSIKSIRLLEREKDNVTVFVTLKEGVTIEIRKALERLDEKLEAGLAKYASLTDGEKIEGSVLCYESLGKIVALHTRRSEG